MQCAGRASPSAARPAGEPLGAPPFPGLRALLGAPAKPRSRPAGRSWRRDPPRAHPTPQGRSRLSSPSARSAPTGRCLGGQLGRCVARPIHRRADGREPCARRPKTRGRAPLFARNVDVRRKAWRCAGPEPRGRETPPGRDVPRGAAAGGFTRSRRKRSARSAGSRHTPSSAQAHGSC